MSWVRLAAEEPGLTPHPGRNRGAQRVGLLEIRHPGGGISYEAYVDGDLLQQVLAWHQERARIAHQRGWEVFQVRALGDTILYT